ncbi:MAG: PD40 domain-containing protein [Labilithrix sp.]|nr:PD40 domain-containing protein [Labilithrix sp.]
MRALERLTLAGSTALAACNAIVGFGDLERVTGSTEQGGDGGDDGASQRDATPADDAPTSDAPPGPPCDPALPFGAPTALGAPVNSTSGEQFASFTADELTIVFSRRVDFNETILLATRASRQAPFSAPAPIDGLTQGLSVTSVGLPALTADGLMLFYSGESGDDADIYTASRAIATAPFGAPRRLTRLATPQVETYPAVMHDGAELWFTSERLGGITRHLFRSVRDDIGDYQAPTLVAELRSSNNEAGVAFSPDGLTVYFGSDRPGGLGDSDVWVATRATLQAAFGQATPVTALNSARTEFPTWVSPDGCRLYLVSDRAGSMDVFVATRP